MSIGWLLVINILFVPFLAEMDACITKHKRPKSLRCFFTLTQTRKERWFKGYIILLLVFFALAISPSSSGKTHPASTGMILAIFAVQATFWIILVLKMIRFNKGEDNGS